MIRTPPRSVAIASIKATIRRARARRKREDRELGLPASCRA